MLRDSKEFLALNNASRHARLAPTLHRTFSVIKLGPPHSDDIWLMRTLLSFEQANFRGV